MHIMIILAYLTTVTVTNDREEPEEEKRRNENKKIRARDDKQGECQEGS